MTSYKILSVNKYPLNKVVESIKSTRFEKRLEPGKWWVLHKVSYNPPCRPIVSQKGDERFYTEEGWYGSTLCIKMIDQITI